MFRSTSSAVARRVMTARSLRRPPQGHFQTSASKVWRWMRASAHRDRPRSRASEMRLEDGLGRHAVVGEKPIRSLKLRVVGQCLGEGLRSSLRQLIYQGAEAPVQALVTEVGFREFLRERLQARRGLGLGHARTRSAGSDRAPEMCRIMRAPAS
jgi:hypothetical protein